MEPAVVEPFVPPFAPNPNGRRYTIEELLHLGNNLPIITCFINAFKPPAFEYGIFQADGGKSRRAAPAKAPNRRNSYSKCPPCINYNDFEHQLTLFAAVNLQSVVPGRWNYPTLEMVEAEGKPYQEENLLRMLSEDARNAWNAGKLHGPKSGEQTHTAFKSIGNTAKGNRQNGAGANGTLAHGSIGQNAKTGAYNTTPSRSSTSNRDLRSEYASNASKPIGAPSANTLPKTGPRMTPSSILITDGRREVKHANVSFAVPTPANTPMATPRKSDVNTTAHRSSGSISVSPTARSMPGQLSHLSTGSAPILIVPAGAPARLPNALPMPPVMQPLQSHGNIQMSQSSNLPFYTRVPSSVVNPTEAGTKGDHDLKTVAPNAPKAYEANALEARRNGQQIHQASPEAHANQASPTPRSSTYGNGTGSIGYSGVSDTSSMRKVPGLFGRGYVPGIAQRQQDPFKQQGLYTPINRPEQDWQHQANLYGLVEDSRPQNPIRQPVPAEMAAAAARPVQRTEEPSVAVSASVQTPPRTGNSFASTGASFASANRPSVRPANPVEMTPTRPKPDEMSGTAAPSVNSPTTQQQQEIVRQRLAMHQQRIQQIQEAQRAEQQEQDLLAMQLRRHHLIQQQQVEQMSRIQQQQLLLQQQQMAEQQRLHQLMYAQFMAGCNQGQVVHAQAQAQAQAQAAKDTARAVQAPMHSIAGQHPPGVAQVPVANLSFSDVSLVHSFSQICFILTLFFSNFVDKLKSLPTTQSILERPERSSITRSYLFDFRRLAEMECATV